MTPMDFEALKQWIGKTETADDHAATVPLQALSATLDRDDAPARFGDEVPPCWHWLYFLPLHRASGIGTDGHPQRGGCLPPVPLPRRMWAGSRIAFERPLLAGEALSRTSWIEDISVKEGRTGTLVFVGVRHEIAGTRGRAIVEDHDIVTVTCRGPATRPRRRSPLAPTNSSAVASCPTRCCCSVSRH